MPSPNSSCLCGPSTLTNLFHTRHSAEHSCLPLFLGEGDHWTLSGNAGWRNKQWWPSHALFLPKCYIHVLFLAESFLWPPPEWGDRLMPTYSWVFPFHCLLEAHDWENFFFSPSLTICGILVPLPGMEPDTALEAQCLKEWTSSEISTGKSLKPPAFNPFKLTISYNY